MSKPSLNHAYRLVWNDSQGGFVPVAENARSHRKSNTTSAVLLCSALLSAPALAADLPTGGVVVGGAGSIGQNGNAMTIQQDSSKLAIDWNSFNVGQGHSVTFNQPGRDAVALNRVLGSDVSVIQGAINANGQVFLVNPNGVLFTPDAQVNVGGIVASTLAISTSDFMAGNYRFAGDSSNAIVNQGNITTAPGGSIALIAAKISNTGSLSAPGGNVLLGAGSKVTLDLGGPVKLEVEQAAIDALIEQGGAIKADGGSVYLTAKAAGELASTVINHTGITEAQTLATGEKGEIVLLGDMHNDRILVAGTLDASAPHGGDGGFVETSAASVRIEGGLKVTTKAASGQTGKWLIDPTDFTVGAGSASQTDSGIGAETLSISLESTDVELQTVADGSEAGDIHVNAAVEWEADTTLTLSAHGDININAAITATGDNAGLVLNHGGYQQNGTVADGTDYHVKAPVTLSGENASLSINGQSYTLIHSIEQLDAIDTPPSGSYMRPPLTGYYALARSLDAAGTPYTSALVSEVKGTLAGLGHVITGLTIDAAQNQVGVFGTLAEGGVIRDIGVRDSDVQSLYSTVGGLVGRNHGRISNAYFTGTVSAGGSDSGGLVGINDISGVIQDSFSAGTVTGGGANIGGLVGSHYGHISRSYSSADVLSTSDYVGGLVGRSQSGTTGMFGGSPYTSTLDSVYATGNVTGVNFVGGLVGVATANTLESAYATGDVTGVSYIGGLIGGNYGVLSRSYATGNVSGSGEMIGGLVGYNSATLIEGSHATGSVTGTTAGGGSLGGLVGTSDGTITQSYATGAVSSTGNEVGGLVGRMSGDISYAYSTGDVTGGDHTGGLIGFFARGEVGNVYASGAVSGTGSNKSAIFGWKPGLATLDGAHWDSDSSGQTAAGPVDGTFFNVTAVNADNRYSPTAYTELGTWEQVGTSTVWVAKDAGQPQWIMIEGQTRPMLFSEYSTDIGNAHQLQLMAYDLTADYRLVRDIDASATASGGGGSLWSAAGFDPVGNSSTPFTGSLDGRNHVIGDLYIHRPDTDFLGLFGVTNGGDIHNVGLFDVNISGRNYAGALAGDSYNSSISHAFATGSVSVGNIGNSYAGGLVGQSWFVSISNAYAFVDVQGVNYIGGLVGGSYSSEISNAYASGSVQGDNYIGGLVGLSYRAEISNTYASGSVQGVGEGDYIGGLVGQNDSGNITYSYWNTETSHQSGSEGGEGKTTAELKTAATFATWNISDKGGESTIWRIYEGSTAPLLRSFLKPVSVSLANKTYDGQASGGSDYLLSDPTASLSGSLSYSTSSKNAGTYRTDDDSLSVIHDLHSHQQGYDIIDKTDSLTINKKTVGVSVTAENKTYDGSVAATVNGVLNSDDLIDGDEVSFSGQASGTFANKNAGTGKTVNVSLAGATLSGADAGNYQLAGSGGTPLTTTATINQAIISAVSGITAEGKDYDGTTSATLDTSAATFAGIIAGDTLAVASASAAFADKNAGEGKTVNVSAITLGGLDAGNYSLADTTATATATILTKELEVNGSTAVSRTYDGTTAVQVNTGDLAGTIGADEVSVSGSGALADKNAGFSKQVTVTYTLAGDDSGNYHVVGETLNADIWIKTLDLSGSSAVSKTYDGSTDAQVSVGTVAGIVDGDEVSVTGSGTFAGKDAGIGKKVYASYTLSGKDSGNYRAIEETLIANILAKALQISGSSVASKTYDGGTDAQISAGTLAGIVDGDSVSVAGSGAFADKNAGTGKQVTVTYQLSGKDSGNYIVLGETRSADILAKVLQISGTTVDGKTYDGNTTASVNAGTLTGLVAGETLGLGATGDFDSANAGARKVTVEYTLIDGGGMASNYTLADTAHSATIDPRAITVTADSLSKTYGDADPALGWRITTGNLVGNDTLSGALTRASGENVGSYAIDASGLANGNYLVTAHNGTLTIDPRPITVTADSLSKTYGDADPALGWSITAGSLVGNDTLSGALTRASGENVGSYAIDASGLANGNYLVSVHNGTLTIAPRPITVTADNLSKTHGGNDPTLTWRVTQGNLVGNDVLNGALVRESGEGAGRYVIDAGGLSNGNYLITAVDGVLVIQDGRQTESAIATAQALPAVPLVRQRSVEPGAGPGGLEFVALESQTLSVDGVLPQAGGSTAGFARVWVVEGGIHVPPQTDLQEGI